MDTDDCVPPLSSGGVGSYDLGSGALIEASTGYKLIVGSQNAAQDTLGWDARDYPCNRTQPGPDCTPHCLFNVLDDLPSVWSAAAASFRENS